MACEHGSRQALTGFSVVCEQMGNETCSLNSSDFIISRHHNRTRIVVWKPQRRY